MTINDAMAEIKTTMDTFVVKLSAAIQDEVRRQMLEKLDEAIRMGGVPAAVAPEPKRSGPKVGTKAQPKPCPKCGVLNTARRYRFYCPQHRS